MRFEVSFWIEIDVDKIEVIEGKEALCNLYEALDNGLLENNIDKILKKEFEDDYAKVKDTWLVKDRPFNKEEQQ